MATIFGSVEVIAIKEILRVAPEKLIQEAAAVNTVLHNFQWLIGRIVNDFYASGISGGKAITYDDAVRTTLTLIPLARRFSTVKAYGLVTRAFPLAVRQKYRHDDIPFSHFAYALSFPEAHQTAPTRYAVLDYSIWEWVQTGGRKKTSVRKLKEVFEGTGVKNLNTVTIHGYAQSPNQSTPIPANIFPTNSGEDPLLNLLMMLTEIEKALPSITKADGIIGKATALFISQVRQRFSVSVKQSEKSTVNP